MGRETRRGAEDKTRALKQVVRRECALAVWISLRSLDGHVHLGGVIDLLLLAFSEK